MVMDFGLVSSGMDRVSYLINLHGWGCLVWLQM